MHQFRASFRSAASRSGRYQLRHRSCPADPPSPSQHAPSLCSPSNALARRTSGGHTQPPCFQLLAAASIAPAGLQMLPCSSPSDRMPSSSIREMMKQQPSAKPPPARPRLTKTKTIALLLLPLFLLVLIGALNFPNEFQVQGLATLSASAFTGFVTAATASVSANQTASFPAAAPAPSPPAFRLLMAVFTIADRIEGRARLRLVRELQPPVAAHIDVKCVLCNLTTDKDAETLFWVTIRTRIRNMFKFRIRVEFGSCDFGSKFGSSKIRPGSDPFTGLHDGLQQTHPLIGEGEVIGVGPPLGLCPPSMEC